MPGFVCHSCCVPGIASQSRLIYLQDGVGDDGPAVNCAGITQGNCYPESFFGKLRDELSDLKIFYILREVTMLIEQKRMHDNLLRSRSGQTQKVVHRVGKVINRY